MSDHKKHTLILEVDDETLNYCERFRFADYRWVDNLHEYDMARAILNGIPIPNEVSNNERK